MGRYWLILLQHGRNSVKQPKTEVYTAEYDVGFHRPSALYRGTSFSILTVSKQQTRTQPALVWAFMDPKLLRPQAIQGVARTSSLN